MDVILSTRNPSKLLQIQKVFEGSNIHVHTLDEVGIEGEVVEDGVTLEENAFKKARFAYDHTQKNSWVMSDDSGIFINAVHGEPGVYSARWAGEGKSTEEIMQYCLDRLKDAADRSAVFRTCVVVLSPVGVQHTFTGEVTGKLLEAPRVPPQPKMPYSSLFVPDGQEKSWAEMTTEEENAISHRGIAFRQVRSFLESAS